MSRQTVVGGINGFFMSSTVTLVTVILVGILSTFVQVQSLCPSNCPHSAHCLGTDNNVCCPEGQYWNDSTTTDSQTTTDSSLSTMSPARNECVLCEEVITHCTACYLTNTSVICTACQPGLVPTNDGSGTTICKPGESSSLAVYAIVIIGVVCGIVGAAAIFAIVVVACRHASRHRPDVIPRPRLPRLDELDELPTAVVTSSGRNPLKKLSTMVRATRYTPGPESQRHVGGGGAPDLGAVGTQRPTVVSVHYDACEQQTSFQEHQPTAQSTVVAPSVAAGGGRGARAARAIPPVPNGNSKKPSPLPIRPERPPSMMPEEDSAVDGEIYANSPTVNQEVDDDTANNIRGRVNASYNQQQQQQHVDDDDDDDDGEVYANNDELASPAAAAVTSSQVDSDIIDLLKEAAPIGGREYVNIDELRREIQQQQRQQQNAADAAVQDAVSDEGDQEVYENVVVPAAQPAKQKPRPAVRPRPR